MTETQIQAVTPPFLAVVTDQEPAPESPSPPIDQPTPLDLAFDLWRSSLLAQGIALTWFWGLALMLARNSRHPM